MKVREFLDMMLGHAKPPDPAARVTVDVERQVDAAEQRSAERVGRLYSTTPQRLREMAARRGELEMRVSVRRR